MSPINDDDGHSSGSSTCLPNEGFASTVPETPNVRSHLLTSPLRPATSLTSSRYPLRSTPEREHSGSSSFSRPPSHRERSGSSLSSCPVCVITQTQESTPTIGVARGGVAGGRVALAAGRGAVGRGVGVAARGRVAVGQGVGIAARGRVPGVTRQSSNPRSGVINYSSEECTALLQCIQAVLPIGNEQWQMVAELHGNQYSHCNRTAESIRRKFSALANVQPGSGNPTVPPLILRAKQIREAINFKAGVTDADVSDFFDDAQDVDDNPLEGAVDVVAAVEEETAEPVDVPAIITAATATAATNATAGCRASTNSSTIAPSVASSKARTKHNQLISAIESSSDSTSNAFSTFLQQRQMAEEFEWRQRRLEREEERARREEELHEMRRKESRQQEQFSMLMQMAVTGMMTYLGAKKPRNRGFDDDDSVSV